MRALRILGWVVGGLLMVVAVMFGGLQTAPGQRLVATLISKAASTPDGGLDLAGLSGFFPTDLRVSRIAYRDRQGPWLTVENLHLRWSFTSLLRGRLQVEELSAERLGVLRPPQPSQEKPADTSGGTFRLPIDVELQSFSIGDLHLAAPVAQVDSHWKLAGSASLPADLAQARLVLSGDRLDGPAGRLAADVRFDAQRRTVDGEISLVEKRGGVTAALLQRPDIEDLSMRLVARGDAQAGKAELTVSAGDAAQATGRVAWEPSGGATVVSAQLDAAGPGLPEGPLADLARGPVVLTVDATIDDKLVTVSVLKFTAGTLGLDGSARYDRVADRLGATATLHANEPGALGPLTSGARWRALHLEAKADLAALTTRPHGTIDLSGTAEEVSLQSLDSRLPPIGNTALSATLSVSDGRITVTSLDVGSPLASVKGTGSYLPATRAGDAKATISVANLAPFSALAGRALSGSATVDVDTMITGDGVKAGWQGTLRGMSADGLPADLIASKVDVSGTATWRRDEAWSLSDVRVASETGTLGVSGHGRGATGELDLSLDLPKLALLQSDLGGGAKLSGKIGLRGDGTDVRLTVALSDLEHGQIVSRKLALSGSGTVDAAGAVKGAVKAEGDLAGQPLSLEGRVERDAAGGMVVPTFRGRWASAVLDIDDLAITQGRTSGYAHLRMERLQDASVLAGTALAGSIDAEVTADDRAANGRVTVRVLGTELRSGTFAIGALDFRGTIDDPMTTGATAATLTASRVVGAADINRLSATASGDRKALVIALQASGAQTSANASAKVELAGEDLVIGLTRFDGRHSGIPVSLAAPTRLHIAGERIAIEPTNLRVGGGRLSVRGTLAPTASDMQIDVAGLPLSMIDAVAPGTNLEGTLQGKMHVTGGMAAPLVDATYSVAGLRLRRPDAALLPPLALQGSGSLMGRQASIDAKLGTAGATSLVLKAKATMPRGAAPLSGSASVAGTIDMAPFAPLMGNDVRNITGTLKPALTLEFAGPRVTGRGAIDFSNGAVALPISGLRLSGGEGRIVLEGDTLQIQRLTFQTGRNGSLTASGTMRLDAQQGLVPDIAVTSRNALLVNRPDLVATVSTNLKVTGSTVGGIDITGPVTIDRAEIAVGAQQSAAYPTLEVREVNKPGVPNPVQAVQAVQANPPPRKAPPPGATPIKLALSINAPQAVFVRGRGLDAEMAGQLEVGGSPAAPTVVGGLTLRRGDFNLAGRRLNFSRGVVTLDNLDRIDPRLDFVASTNVQSTTINVAIGGTSRLPTITVTSVPSLPPDEVMAMLLFGKPSSGLSAFELAQAAQGLAELTGRASGAGALSRLRAGLGLDRLSVGSSGTGSSGTSANSPVSIEAGRYVAPGVYVGARQGAAGNSSRGVVQLEVFDHVKIEGDIGADSNGRVGVKVEWDY